MRPSSRIRWVLFAAAAACAVAAVAPPLLAVKSGGRADPRAREQMMRNLAKSRGRTLTEVERQRIMAPLTSDGRGPLGMRFVAWTRALTLIGIVLALCGLLWRPQRRLAGRPEPRPHEPRATDSAAE